ncbi:MAG: flagellin [Gemmatimonadetes bacterium]|jgi:flagellin|nr:flagellin [Gemmatimonadota bacterium]
MPIRINTNLAANNIARQLRSSSRALAEPLERLSSGLRINRAADDAAGLSVREGLRADLAGLQASTRNTEQAANLLQTAEGSLGEINNILVRMRELATESASSTASDSNRESIQAEFSELSLEIDRIAQATTYNDEALLSGFGNSVDAASTAVTASDETGLTGVSISGADSGTFTFIDNAGDSELTLGNGEVTQTLSIGTLLDGDVVATGTQVVANFDRLGVQITLAGADVSGAAGQFTDGDLEGRTLVIEEGTGGSFQIGPDDAAFNRVEVSIPDLRASGDALNVDDSSVASLSEARSALTSIDQAATRVAQERGNLGAAQNRLAFNLSATENRIEQVQASESAISDADFAEEVSRYTRAQVLTESATALLAQANLQPQRVLQLLLGI